MSSAVSRARGKPLWTRRLNLQSISFKRRPVKLACCLPMSKERKNMLFTSVRNVRFCIKLYDFQATYMCDHKWHSQTQTFRILLHSSADIWNSSWAQNFHAIFQIRDLYQWVVQFCHRTLRGAQGPGCVLQRPSLDLGLPTLSWKATALLLKGNHELFLFKHYRNFQYIYKHIWSYWAIEQRHNTHLSQL